MIAPLWWCFKLQRILREELEKMKGRSTHDIYVSLMIYIEEFEEGALFSQPMVFWLNWYSATLHAWNVSFYKILDYTFFRFFMHRVFSIRRFIYSNYVQKSSLNSKNLQRENRFQVKSWWFIGNFSEVVFSCLLASWVSQMYNVHHIWYT